MCAVPHSGGASFSDGGAAAEAARRGFDWRHSHGGVRSLSGMVQTPGGAVRLFSILMNRRKGTSMAGSKELQDAMVTAIYHGRLK